MIYAFSEDTRCIRPLLNNTVDLHVQAIVHHRNLAGTEIPVGQ
jgi:hypothetical protein